jgi:hypothetical protein
VGSSDFTRVKSYRASLELNHKEFENSSIALLCKSMPVEGLKEPSPNTLVRVKCFGKYITCTYATAKSAGFSWIY